MKNRKILILLLLCLVALLSACKPMPDMTVRVQNGDIVFDLDRESANGFLSLLLQDERTGDDLWSVNLSYYPGGEIKYGELPPPFTTWNGNPGRAREEAPAAPLPADPVKVTLTYQYDRPFAASASRIIYRLQVDPDAKEAFLEEVDRH